MAAIAAFSTGQLQQRVAVLQQELEGKNAQLQAVQRNYLTVSSILHERLKLLDEASQQLVAQRSSAEQLQIQLQVSRAEAEVAEKQLKHGSHLPDQLQQLNEELKALRAAREEDYQQRLLLQEQLSRVKQDLYAAANGKQALTEQLHEQYSQNQAANTAVNKLRQQLEDEKAEGRATASQLHALRDVLSRSMAQQQDLEKQLAALKARARAAEDTATAEQARTSKLQQELTNAKGGQANNALRLLEIQTNQQLMEEKLGKATAALAQEQAARAQLDGQVVTLQAQLASMQHRAEAAEAAAAAAAVSLSQAQRAAAEASALQFAAEEARKTADAATKLVTHRLTEAQQLAAEERAVFEATQRELRQYLAQKDADLELLHQQQQGWRFRQLEFMTRVLHTLDTLQGRVQALDQAATTYMAALQQQHEQQHSQLTEEFNNLTAWEGCAVEVLGTGSRINTALVHLQQQWVAKQQKLRSSDKGMQVLQKQLEQLEQQLSMANIMERKLRNELADAQSARSDDQEKAKAELQHAASVLAEAEAAAAAAIQDAAQHQAAVAQLETKLATAESSMVALRFMAASKDSEMSGMGGDVKAAGRRLQQLARAAIEMATMLERVGALQPQDVAVLLSRLGVVGRPSTASRTPSRPSTPLSAAAGPAGQTSSSAQASDTAAAAAAPASKASRASSAGSADTGASKQLLDGLGSLQQQMQVMLQAMQQLAESYPKLAGSWQESEREVASTAAKLLHVEESLASNYTCLVCMKVFDHPVSVVPCGHVYCKQCLLSSLGGQCRECINSSSSRSDADHKAAGVPSVKPEGGAGFIPVPALEQLCAKYEYRLLTLKGLQSLLAQRQLHGIQAVTC